MEPIVLRAEGIPFAAVYFSALVVLLLFVVWLMRRWQGQSGLWDVQRFGYWPVLLIVAYYAVIWHWLFYDQFVRINQDSQTVWYLQYRMPDREYALNAYDIADIRGENLPSLTGGSTARIIIEMRDGSRYRSAQIPRYEVKDFVARLRALSAHNQVVP